MSEYEDRLRTLMQQMQQIQNYTSSGSAWTTVYE